MKTIVILSLVLVLAMAGMANAGIYAFQPSPADLYDLDHYQSYTWGIDFTVPPGEQIVEAFLTFNNIYDWTVEDNDHLYIHLLDNPQSGVWVHYDGQGGGNQFSGQGAVVDDWSDPAGGPGSARPLAYQFSALAGSQSGTTLLDDLRAYAMSAETGKANFGFGIDPDCHYYNCGITLTIETDAVPCGQCEGKVTQLTLQYLSLGTEPASIRVIQKKDNKQVFEDLVSPGGFFTFNGTDRNGTLGTDIYMYVNELLNTTIHTSCSQPIGPGLIRGDFKVIEGYSLNGGLLCPVVEPLCGPCEGKVTQLTLRYHGDSANVKVMQKKIDAPVFEGWVEKDNDFTFNGKDENGTLGTDIYIYVNNVLMTTTHTSCSQPIGPGLVSANFEVIAGLSLRGGLLCPIRIGDDG